MTFTAILCFTNHPLLVVHSCPSAGMKSNRVTSDGTSFVISRREMFLPMQDLEPAPNCSTRISDHCAIDLILWEEFNTNRKQIVLHRGQLCWIDIQPALGSKFLDVGAPD